MTCDLTDVRLKAETNRRLVWPGKATTLKYQVTAHQQDQGRRL